MNCTQPQPPPRTTRRTIIFQPCLFEDQPFGTFIFLIIVTWQVLSKKAKNENWLQQTNTSAVYGKSRKIHPPRCRSDVVVCGQKFLFPFWCLCVSFHGSVAPSYITTWHIYIWLHVVVDATSSSTTTQIEDSLQQIHSVLQNLFRS